MESYILCIFRLGWWTNILRICQQWVAIKKVKAMNMGIIEIETSDFIVS